eukprot:scaffold395_cov243-Pinguiococcus_pyrenoidosus.AAC.2
MLACPTCSLCSVSGTYFAGADQCVDRRGPLAERRRALCSGEVHGAPRVGRSATPASMMALPSLPPEASISCFLLCQQCNATALQKLTCVPPDGCSPLLTACGWGSAGAQRLPSPPT